MALVNVIPAQTTAVANKGAKYLAQQREVAFIATGLATTETITPYVAGTTGGWTALFDSGGNQLKFTATKPQMILPGGGLHYAFEKDVTAAATSLDAAPIHGTP